MHEILEHTTDVRLHVTASTLQELFTDAVRALMEAMKAETRPDELRDELREELVTVEAPDLTALLVDFLGEVLLRAHVEQRRYEVAAIVVDDARVEATLIATPATFHEDVKAVTYHEADVVQSASGFETNLVLDI
ncbi:MAG TPA: archease [Thermoanaerobaculia bacterium]|jgi:SHS2 domain-containing protein